MKQNTPEHAYIHMMDKDRMLEIATPQAPLKIKKQWYLRPNDEWGIRLSDSGHTSPYTIKCFKCEQTEYTLEIRFTPSFNLRHFSFQTVGFDLEEIISYGGVGPHYVWLQCQQCQAHYYVGVGWFEPNNGRSVFVLHTILEVEPLESP